MKKVCLTEAMVILGYNKKSSAVAWCKRNNVTVFNGPKGNYVMDFELKIAHDREMKGVLKRKYPKEWELMYDQLQDGGSLKFQPGMDQNSGLQMNSKKNVRESLKKFF